MFDNKLSFIFSRTPKVVFGSNKFRSIMDVIPVKKPGSVLLVTGSSFKRNPLYDELTDKLNQSGMNMYELEVTGEPSPDLVDEAVNKYRHEKTEAVIAIGGGSVIDTGKAVSAMLTKDVSVMSFLEGAGEGKRHDGKKVPFVAVPTTSGTGSEATKNAVLSRVGENGFKNSLRHDNFVPDVALIDPMLTLTCPPDITAYSGMDALCQLIGSYMSTSANPLTDALALSAMGMAWDALEGVATNEPCNINKRTKMAYAAFISGITLANAGLGVVHGFASSIGGFFNIPHGVVCGTILPEAVKMNILELLKDKDKNAPFIHKYAKLGEIFAGTGWGSIEKSCKAFETALQELKAGLKIPGLGEFGVTERDAERIALKTSNKNNPVKLDKVRLKQIIINCL